LVRLVSKAKVVLSICSWFSLTTGVGDVSLTTPLTCSVASSLVLPLWLFEAPSPALMLAFVVFVDVFFLVGLVAFPPPRRYHPHHPDPYPCPTAVVPTIGSRPYHRWQWRTDRGSYKRDADAVPVATFNLRHRSPWWWRGIGAMWRMRGLGTVGVAGRVS